jgi:hypothetical protein
MSKGLVGLRVRHRRNPVSLRLPADLLAAVDEIAAKWQKEASRTQAKIDRTFVVEVLLREGVDRES